MGTLGNMDGSFDGVLKASEQLKGLPKIIQKYMTAGIFQDELGWAKHFDDDSIDKLGGVDSFIVQIMNLDKAQQDALLSVSKFSDGLKEEIERLIQAARAGEKFNTQLFEQEASKDDKLSKGVLNEVMQTTGMKDADGNYLLTNTKDVCDLLEQYANDANNAQKAQELFNAGLLEQSDNGYKVSASLLKLIGAKKSDIVTTGIATAGQIAWNYAMQIGKQLLLSLGVTAVTFIATKLVDYIMNLKTNSEELVDAMNDSHEAAQQATKDVEEIQSKIDELNKSLKDAGVDKIEDIVDPAERERLQAINDMLQAQLELKKQLEKDANDKANADTSAVVNDKTEDSIVKTRTVNVSYAEGGANAGTHQVAEKVSKTESLEEHTAALNELIDKRRELATAGKEDTQEYKNNEAAITAETKKVEELSSAVSENMNSYETDADSFAKYKGEYVAGTNAMTAATKALANANDDVGESASNYETLLQKMKAAKADVDNGDSERIDYRYMSAVDSLKRSGITTGDQILTLSHDSSKGTDQQKTAIAMLREEAAKAKLSIEDYVHGLEEMGEVSTTAALHTKELSTTISELDNIQSAYKTLTETTKEYNKSGYLTMDTLQSLLQLDPKYYNCLIDTDGQLKVNTQTIRTMTKARLADAKAEQLQLALDKMTTIKDLKSAKEYLGTATANAADAEEQFSAMYNQILTTDVRMHGPQYNAMKEALDQIRESYYSIAKLIDETGEEPLDKLFGTTDKTSKSTKQASSAIDAWSTLTSAMKEYNEQGYITFQTLKSLTDLEDKYSSMLKKNDITGQLEMRTNDFYKLMKAELKAAQIKGDGASEAQYTQILQWTDRNIKDQTMSYWDLVAAIEGYSSALSEAKEITDGFKSAWDNGKTVKQKTEKSRTGALDYEGTEAQSSALQDLLKYSEYDPTLIKKAYNTETGKIDLSGDTLKTAVVASLREQAKAARTEGGAAADAIAASYERSANNIEGDVISVQDYFDGLGSTIDEINEKIDDMQSAWTDLNDVTNEYNIYDGLSVDSLQKLLTMSPEYLACLQLEGGQLSVNADLMKDMLIKQLETKAALLESKDETRDQAKILREMIAQLEKNGISALSGLDQYAKNLEDTLSNIKSLFSDLLGVFEQANTDKSNDLKIQGDAWLEVIDKRIDALNEQNDAQERAIELSKAQDALEKAKANKTVHVYHSGGSGFEWEADQNAIRDAQSTLDDTIRKNRKEDEIERLNKLKKAVQENNELIGSSFEDYEKKKKYLAEFDKMTYDDMISYNENWKNSILGNMKSTQVVTNVNEIITKIEKLITTLETLNNVLTWISTLGKSTDGGGLTGLFSNGGLLSKVGKFFNIASEDGLGAALNQTGEWFSGKLSAALEANPNNPIIKAFSNLWTAVGEGASKFFTETSGTGLGGIIKTGIEKAGTLISGLGGSNGVLGTIATTVKTGIGSIGTALTGGSSAIPVIGPIIAVAVNDAVQQFGKISKENTKIWADQNSTTGEKIVSSVGNVLYHLSPVEGWDKSVQYAKMAAEGEGLWQKLEYGAKSLYYATGLGTILDNIWGTIKSILKLFGVKFKDNNDGISTSSSVSGKKGIGSWKIWPWNWGKKAKGDKKIKKSAPYNVDEEGDEIIVRKPQTGRMTYLEKGDGVIPANETENLMTIGKNPLKWLTENVGKILGSSAAKDVVEGKVDEGAVTKASQVLANSVVNTFSSAWNSVKMSTEDLIDSMNDSFQGGSTSVPTAAGTILSRVKTLFGKSSLGKLLGSFNSGVSGSIAKSAKEYSSTTELLSGTKSKTIDTMNKMRSTFESTWASVAKETGVSKDKITSISSEMFSKMETLVNQTYDAIDSNAGISSDQLNDITKSLFRSMQNIYTSGWNAIYATSTGMSQKTANTLNSAYKSSSDSCTQEMDTIRNTMVGSWEQCGGGVQNLANGTYQTLSKAWANSSGSAEDMLSDTRACFDSGWGAVEQGVSNLANNPKDRLSTAWAEITSQSNATFGAEGTLKTDADNAWSNVEPGTTNLADNMKWVMDQSYTAMKNGCSDAVDEINRKLNTTADSFKAVADATDDVNKKASDSEEAAKKTGHAWYEWVLNPVGTFADTVTKYNTEDKSKNNFLQNAVHTVTHPVSSLVEAGGKALKYVGNAAKDFFGSLFGKHASGLKSASNSHFANVDELGPELLVRKPQSGRYTYLETGDGVVPADITSKLFEMGGNPNKWFSEQMAKYGSQAITTKSTGNTSFSTGNIVINNPVGNSEDLASEIKKNFSTRMAQEWNKR